MKNSKATQTEQLSEQEIKTNAAYDSLIEDAGIDEADTKTNDIEVDDSPRNEDDHDTMNDPMGSSTRAMNILGETPSTDSYDSATQALDELARIDPDSLTNEVAMSGQDNIQEGLTPMHRQNIDESRIDEVLVEDNLDDDDYPTIQDIADNDAVAHSFNDDL